MTHSCRKAFRFLRRAGAGAMTPRRFVTPFVPNALLARISAGPLAAAPAYAALGLRVVPLCPPDHATRDHPGIPCDPACDSHGNYMIDLVTGRHVGTERRTNPDGYPELRWRGYDGLAQEPRTVADVRDWGCSPSAQTANIGVQMGEDLLVLEMTGTASVALLRALAGGEVPLPSTWAMTSERSGGHALVYRRPSGPPARSVWLRPHMRDGGAYALQIHANPGSTFELPPSCVRFGPNSWLPGRSPWEADLAPAPAWVTRLIRPIRGEASIQLVGERTDLGVRYQVQPFVPQPDGYLRLVPYALNARTLHAWLPSAAGAFLPLVGSCVAGEAAIKQSTREPWEMHA